MKKFIHGLVAILPIIVTITVIEFTWGFKSLFTLDHSKSRLTQISNKTSQSADGVVKNVQGLFNETTKNVSDSISNAVALTGNSFSLNTDNSKSTSSNLTTNVLSAATSSDSSPIPTSPAPSYKAPEVKVESYGDIDKQLNTLSNSIYSVLNSLDRNIKEIYTTQNNWVANQVFNSLTATELSSKNAKLGSIQSSEPLSYIYGGTGISQIPLQGQIIVGGTSGYSLANLISGSNVQITQASGEIQISASNNFVTGVETSAPRAGQRLLTFYRNGLTDLTTGFTLSSSELISVLGYTPLRNTSDSMSGNLGVSGNFSSANATISNSINALTGNFNNTLGVGGAFSAATGRFTTSLNVSGTGSFISSNSSHVYNGNGAHNLAAAYINMGFSGTSTTFNNAYSMGLFINNLRGLNDQVGNDTSRLRSLEGMSIQYGHYTNTAPNSNPQTSSAIGLAIRPYHYDGVISSSAGIFIAAPSNPTITPAVQNAILSDWDAPSFFQGSITAQDLRANGQVGMTFTGAATGTTLVQASNGWFYRTSSSERYKENIIRNYQPENLMSFLDISPIKYDYKNSPAGNTDIVGFSADDLYNHGFDFLVNLNENGQPESLRDTSIIAYHHGILKTLNEKIKKLEETPITALSQSFESKIDSIKETLDSLSVTIEDGKFVINSDTTISGNLLTNNVSVTGNLKVGTISFDSLENSIEVLGPECDTNDPSSESCTTNKLSLMPNKSGNIEVFGGDIKLLADGTITSTKVEAKSISLDINEGSNSLSQCTKGEMRLVSENNNSYIYVCMESNTWKRASLESF